MPAPRLFYDFNSPYAYLAFARAESVLGPDVELQPVAFAFMLRAHDRTPWSLTDETSRRSGMRECEARAARCGLPPLRWPPGWPVGSYALAPLRAALVAREHGAMGEFSQAAFARHFADGLPLTGPRRGECCESAAVLEGVRAAWRTRWSTSVLRALSRVLVPGGLQAADAAWSADAGSRRICVS